MYTLNTRLAWFQFIDKLHEKYLNYSEGKEYERRKLKCKSTLEWPEPLHKIFSESGLQG